MTTEAPGMPDEALFYMDGEGFLQQAAIGERYIRHDLHTAALAERDAEIRKLREALQFYGNPEHWHGYDWLKGDDQGHIARAALSAEKEE